MRGYTCYGNTKCPIHQSCGIVEDPANVWRATSSSFYHALETQLITCSKVFPYIFLVGSDGHSSRHSSSSGSSSSRSAINGNAFYYIQKKTLHFTQRFSFLVDKEHLQYYRLGCYRCSSYFNIRILQVVVKDFILQPTHYYCSHRCTSTRAIKMLPSSSKYQEQPKESAIR